MVTSQIHIVVTGGSGQLAQALKDEAGFFPDYKITFLNKMDLDICDEEEIKKVLSRIKPDVLINTAAYTFVDAAEDNSDTAYAINSLGVHNIAKYCVDFDCSLIHISTDYVFDGTSSRNYKEIDPSNPITVYGQSKKAGENAILESGLLKYGIIRTSWLYSAYGSNFVKTMLKLSRERDEISVVDDQVGSPTFANDLANVCLRFLRKLNNTNSGVYHYANKGEVSWYAFAKAIFENRNVPVNLKPVTSEKYPTKASRPKRSVLDATKIQTILKISIPHWEESLQKMLSALEKKD